MTDQHDFKGPNPAVINRDRQQPTFLPSPRQTHTEYPKFLLHPDHDASSGKDPKGVLVKSLAEEKAQLAAWANLTPAPKSDPKLANGNASGKAGKKAQNKEDDE